MVGEEPTIRLLLVLMALLGLLNLSGAMIISGRIPGTVHTLLLHLVRFRLMAVLLSLLRIIMQAEVLVLMIVLIAGNLVITRGIVLWRRPLRIREKVEAKAVALGGGSSGSVRPVLFLGFIDSYFWI